MPQIFLHENQHPGLSLFLLGRSYALAWGRIPPPFFRSQLRNPCMNLWVSLERLIWLKVHKHEIVLNFFWTYIKSLYTLCKFLKKISLLFLRFSPEFRCSDISAVTEYTRNQIFFERYPKNFFFKVFTLVLLNRFLDGFSKFGFFIGEICILIRDFWVILKN